MQEGISGMMVELGNKKEIAEIQIDDLMASIERGLGLLIKDYRWEGKETGEVKDNLMYFSIEDLRSTERVIGVLVDQATSCDEYLASRGFRLLKNCLIFPIRS